MYYAFVGLVTDEFDYIKSLLVKKTPTRVRALKAFEVG
jgi:hypothetical protein